MNFLGTNEIKNIQILFIGVTWNTLFFCLAWTHMWNTAFTDHCLLDFVWPEHICGILPSQITVCWILFGLNTYVEYCLHRSLSAGFCLAWTHMWNTAFTDHCLLDFVWPEHICELLPSQITVCWFYRIKHLLVVIYMLVTATQPSETDLGDPYMVILLDKPLSNMQTCHFHLPDIA